ncbi:DNA sulfur modification protein DndD [Gemmata sp. G18]|uniref:DNA sulfur modification protein DndD n=1 Tax=Gemmata palustris TaxID=2822762 RepID=A0ABS5BMN1_9BACT|nr:DNA sulfur modification protein DndD [Gemmata palustris]
MEQARNSARDDLSRARQERASLENARLQAEAALKGVEEEFSLVGGRHWEEQQERRTSLAEVGQKCSALETQPLSLSASELPLVMLPDLLAAVAEQDALERVAAESAFVRNLLVERDESLLAALAKSPEFTRTRIAVLSKLMSEDRESRAPGGAVETRVSLHDSVRGQLAHLRESRLEELSEQAALLIEQWQQAITDREDLERLLAATPNETDIGEVMSRLKTVTTELAKLDQQAADLDSDIAEKKQAHETAEQKLLNHLRTSAKEGFAQEDHVRMAALASQTREKMTEFMRRATEKKIDRLSGLITDSFRYLLRKESLVERIQIEPSTFAVTLFDSRGTSLSRDRLSEGEKQIFTISMLWGLARSSSRPLPAVVDTPMARLDSAHRTNLIDRYFPKASHQVIIFSTDTEVDREYYARLQPALARAYHLRHDEKEHSAVAEEGYFWKE